MTSARFVVAAPGPGRAVRRGVLIVVGLLGLAMVKPWGGAEAPPERPPTQTVARATPVARPPESPISSICHESSSWRVATEGSFVGSQIREWGFVVPVAADSPTNPLIPFVVFSFSRLRALGYCAPADPGRSLDLQVVVFRLDDSGASTAVAVEREARTPMSSAAGLFSIADSVVTGPRASPGPEPAASWPPGRYVFALRGPDFGEIWFGAAIRQPVATAER
ncbi:MAG TPA: hypothetical protein VL749_11410 [Patescibacteria group bacterium]|nr:hypothetical protein [Patescibacteria group bacterium]